MKIIIIGGDCRQCEIGERFIRGGATVYKKALDLPIKNSYEAEELSACIASCDIIILPLPLSRDGIYINTPFYSGEKITVDEVFAAVPKDSLILCGKMSDSVREKAKRLHLSFVDYYGNERFLNENAYITAEGAVYLAMQKLPTTIKGTRVMIIGGGRIAKRLFSVLKALGADICFTARNSYDLRWAETLGADSLDLASDTEEIIHEVGKSSVIFNTVPAVVIPDCAFENAKSELIYIELAGDEKYLSPVLAERGIYTVCARSLPSKYAPLSAGNLLYDTLYEIIRERKGEII